MNYLFQLLPFDWKPKAKSEKQRETNT